MRIDTFLVVENHGLARRLFRSPAGGTSPRIGGADIAKHILTDRDQPIVLNDTDVKRAEIVRRFRLYSEQPDEMITFRALSRMKPSHLDFDPRFYQYGGLVGAVCLSGGSAAESFCFTEIGSGVLS